MAKRSSMSKGEAMIYAPQGVQAWDAYLKALQWLSSQPKNSIKTFFWGGVYTYKVAANCPHYKKSCFQSAFIGVIDGVHQY